jgi:hypothetical protein
MKRSLVGFVLSIVLLAGTASEGSVLWDYSPALFGEFFSDYGNTAAGQHFADKISFGSAVSVNGMDIYSSSNWGPLGTSATISFWYDASGLPGALLTSFTANISTIDNEEATTNNVRKHVDFSTAVSLNASTVYWVSMSGTGSSEIVQQFLRNKPPFPGDGYVARFTPALCCLFSAPGDGSWGDMAFRLEGDVAPSTIPEPTSLLLLGSGLAGLGGFAWRRNRRK